MAGDNRTPEDARHNRPTRTTVTLRPENYEVLLRMAKSKKVSASWVVRDAVDKHLAADMPLFKQPLNAASNQE